MKKKGWRYALIGAAAGFLNGLLGAGGGTVLVPLLELSGVESRKAHATSIAVILPLSLFSAFLYLWDTSPQWGELLVFLPLGAAGAVIGARILKKIGSKALHRIFGGIILLSAVRMWFR